MRHFLSICFVISFIACSKKNAPWNPHGLLKDKAYNLVDIKNIESDSIIYASQIAPRNIVAINNHCPDGIFINDEFTKLDSIEIRLSEIIFNPSKNRFYPKLYNDAYVLIDHFHKADTCGGVQDEHFIAVRNSLNNIHRKRARQLGIAYPDTIFSIEEFSDLDSKIFTNVGVRMLDLGVLEKLPPLTADTTDLASLPPRNVLDIHVNATNEIRIRGELEEISRIGEIVELFIMNPFKEEKLAERRDLAYIILSCQRQTDYEVYVSIYTQITDVYNRMWNTEALLKYGVPYNEELSMERRQFIRNLIPKRIHELVPRKE